MDQSLRKTVGKKKRLMEVVPFFRHVYTHGGEEAKDDCVRFGGHNISACVLAASTLWLRRKICKVEVNQEGRNGPVSCLYLCACGCFSIRVFFFFSTREVC